MSRSACEPYRPWIEAQLKLRRNAMAIYQDLVDQHGFAGAYNSVKRFVRQLRNREPEQFDRLPEATAELLQAVVHQRYKLRRSIVVTSNRVVQD